MDRATGQPIPNEQRGPSARRWLMLGVGFLCMFSWFATFQSVPPLLPLIMDELGINFMEAGWLMGLITLPGILVAILAGLLADRYGQKIIVIASFFLLIGGTAVSASGPSYGIIVLGRFLSGIGGVTLFVLSPQLVGQWFEGRELGLAMGIVNMGAPLGTIAAMSVLPLLALNFGWRGSLWLAMLAPALSLALYWVFFNEPPWRPPRSQKSARITFQGIRSVGVSVWILGAAMLLFNASFMSMLTFTPSFVVSVGVSLALAGLIGSASMWPGAALSAVVGYATDRLGRKRTMVALGGFFMAAFTMLIPVYPNAVLPIVLLAGLAKTLIPPPILALTYERCTTANSGLAFGVTQGMASLGMLLGPPAAGWARDISGSYLASYGLMAVLGLLIPTAIVLLWRLERRNPSALSRPASVK